MIGPDASDAPSLDDARRRSPGEAAPVPSKDAAVRWGFGCLVGAVALAGVVSLAALLAFYLQPPTWVQVVLGVTLALGAVLLAWLVATAWGQRPDPQEAEAEAEPGGGDLPRPGGSPTR